MKKRRVLALLLTLVMLLCVAACGGDEEQKKENMDSGKNTEKESVSTTDSLYRLVDEAKTLIADGDYAAAYLLLKGAPLPDDEKLNTPEYTMITSLLEKFAFIPVTAEYEASDWDNGAFSFEYDESNRLVRLVETYKDVDEMNDGFVLRTRETTFERNSHGDCTAIIRNGEAICTYTYEYDGLGRVVSKVKGDGEYGEADTTTYTYTYATEGYLQTERIHYVTEDEDYWREYTYNADGSLLSEENTYWGYELTTYEYNQNGYIVREEYSDGEGYALYTTYDNAGKPLTSVGKAEGNSYTLEYTYDSHGNPIKRSVIRKVDGETETYTEEYVYTYDKAGNILTYSGGNQSGTTTYTYDANDNLISKTSDGTKWVYSYDTEGNLVKTQIYYDDDLSYSATFDKFGNMLTYSDDSQTGTWSYQLVYYPNGVPECVQYGDREASGFFETFMFYE